MAKDKTYYAILTAEVRHDKRLKDKAKLLYAEITALSNTKGYCFASNSYLAKLYDCDNSTISRAIKQLEKFGYIRVEIDKEAGNTRHLYPIAKMPTLSAKTPIPIGNNATTPIGKIEDTPIGENAYHNNISINTTRYNNKGNRYPTSKFDFNNDFWIPYDKNVPSELRQCQSAWLGLTEQQKELVKIHAPKYAKSNTEAYRHNPLKYLSEGKYLDPIVNREKKEQQGFKAIVKKY